MDVELIGAVALIVGAAIGVLGAIAAESRRHQATLREWHLDKRAAGYSAFLDAARARRNHLFWVSIGGSELSGKTAEAFGRERTRLGLIASQESYAYAVDIHNLLTRDWQRIAAAEREGRTRPYPVSPYREWLALLEAAQNSFRRDLGFEAVRLDIDVYVELRDGPQAVDLANVPRWHESN